MLNQTGELPHARDFKIKLDTKPNTHSDALIDV